jgi:hypothetical protein
MHGATDIARKTAEHGVPWNKASYPANSLRRAGTSTAASRIVRAKWSARPP